MKKLLLILLAIVIAVPVLAFAGFLLFFDADSFRPRLAEAVQRATGREFRIEGPLRLTPALTPTVSATGLVLANIPGGSAPEMLRVAQAEISLGLIPLIRGRLEVARLNLEGGRLLLEKGNWLPVAAPAPPPVTTPSATPGAPAEPARPLQIDIRRATLKDWVVTYEGEEIRIPQARLTGTGLLTPLELHATVVARGAEALIEGSIAAPSAFTGADAWPFRINAVIPGARLLAEGEKRATDWRVTLVADVPRLDALSGLAGRPLPRINEINLRVQAAMAAGASGITSIEGRAGSGEFAGVTLKSATIRLAAPGRTALRLDGQGSYRDQPVAFGGEFDPVALQSGHPAPLSLQLNGAGSNLSIYGAWPGEMVVEAQSTDLAALQALAGRPLPPLRGVALRAGVTSIGERFATGARIGQLTLTSSGGDLSGALDVQWAPRPRISGQVTSRRLDLAALVPPSAHAAPGAPAAPAAPAPAPASGRLIPDVPVDLSPLRLADADLRFEFAELRHGQTVVRQVSGRLQNADGKARLDPFSVTPPGGQLTLRAAADATATPPALQIAASGQGLDPVALLGVLGVQSPIAGRTDLDLDVRGQGGDLRALAATATGRLGLAVTDGRLSGRPAQTLGQLPGFGGEVAVNCLALRSDADRGIAQIRSLYLEGTPGRVGGEGQASLRDETLNIRLSVDLRVAGVRVRAPVPLTGTFLQPRLEAAGLAQGALAGDLGRQLERAVPGLGGLLPQQSGAPDLPDCATALNVARGGRSGPVPTPAPQPQQAAPQAPQRPDVNQLLRGLFGR
ncbi:AsmA family protein [Roseococcus sp. YIM B11640]|uniref:AsmA family protein n=1 Tax=Roseococcus sp. YIM B11640 TaxID=3133973 RepID=UPI003C7B1AE0